jgi:hypothetical protein
MTLRTLAVALLTGFLLVVPGASAAHAKQCDEPAYPVPNGSFSKLTAKKTTCAKAARVAVKHYKCRTKTGPAGRCVSKVKGYACNEQRTTSPTGDFAAKVTCTKGQAKVSFSYAQAPS